LGYKSQINGKAGDGLGRNQTTDLINRQNSILYLVK